MMPWHRIPDLSSVKGQESAKRALEVSAAGGHNLLFIGPPGAGKSMLASCLPGILPPLSAREALEVSMVHSLAGTLPGGGLMQRRPYRDPHHSASLPSLVGGGHKVKPGEISLAHHGVLFLDELPEFSRATLEALRQPLETGAVMVARANAHVNYPARFQLIAAMNPCRCGYLGDPEMECTTAPRCGGDYQAKLSGPLLDRIDLQVEVGAVSVADLNMPGGEPSHVVATRVAKARARQEARYALISSQSDGDIPLAPILHSPYGGAITNAQASAAMIDAASEMEPAAQAMFDAASERLRLSARAYHRLKKVALTIADLDEKAADGVILTAHVAEALSYRRLRNS